jgi:hypothetical protein
VLKNKFIILSKVLKPQQQMRQKMLKQNEKKKWELENIVA